MFQINDEIISYKKSTIYNATIDKKNMFCVIKRATDTCMCEELNSELSKLPNKESILWPKLEMSGVDNTCTLNTNKPTVCHFLVYSPQLKPIDWTQIHSTYKIHVRLASALDVLHKIKWQLRACDPVDIMAVKQDDPSTYYFVNYSNIYHHKMPDYNKKLKTYSDHIELISTLIKNPLADEKIKPISEYAFYKYLIKSSMYPEIAKLAKSKSQSLFLKKIKLLFFLKHFDLYLRAKNVPEYIFNKYQKYKHLDAQYYIDYIIRYC